MLKAAAERGVRIYVIVYKEVPQALTRESPEHLVVTKLTSHSQLDRKAADHLMTHH